METLTVEEVKSEVARYWELATIKRSPEEWAALFSFDSVVFGTASVRLESGSLVATRRGREYLTSKTNLTVELGPIHVSILSPAIAVACYICQFRASMVQRGLSEQNKSEVFKDGRMTQLFVIVGGKVRIVHEHFSLPAKTVGQELTSTSTTEKSTQTRVDTTVKTALGFCRNRSINLCPALNAALRSVIVCNFAQPA